MSKGIEAGIEENKDKKTNLKIVKEFINKVEVRTRRYHTCKITSGREKGKHGFKLKEVEVNNDNDENTKRLAWVPMDMVKCPKTSLEAHNKEVKQIAEAAQKDNPLSHDAITASLHDDNTVYLNKEKRKI